MSDRVHLSDHPLLKTKISVLRSGQCDCKNFRELVQECAMLIGYEATADFTLQASEGQQGALATYTAYRLAPSVAFIPILRAGLGMVEGK